MAKKKAAPKKSKKQKPAPKKAKAKAKSSTVKAKKSAPAKAKVVAKSKATAKATGKVAAKPKAARAPVARARTAPRREAADSDTDFRANQEVEIVRPKGRSRVARAGAGSGDLQGISSVEEADSESEDELLEEGQSFEAGIIGGVERAGDEESEVVTHEVLEDDVPLEYDDQDKERP
ncbi:MAG TPA: hypothetical protein VHP80_11665 [Candidatus Acidoferrum sp.]|nr:hypothetical protein [Candidatus Acidoferrum sp.]